jgi:D-alanyl-D-alanine carboxypeptidase
MTRRPSLLLGLALVATLAVPVAAADAPLTTEPMGAEDTAAIDAGVAAIMEANPDVPAMYIGVWDPERGAYVQAYGLADIAAGTPASVDDHFRIGSISKTFLATIVLQLIDEGMFTLEDTVADIDPGLATQFPVYADITIRQLLGMTSGVPDYMNVPGSAVARLVTQTDLVFAPEELIDFGLNGNVQPAGTAGYSTTNYILLQVLAENLTGQPVQTLIAERVTEPLGMAETALPFNSDTALPAPAAHGYIFDACNTELLEDGADPVAPGTDTTDWNASYGQAGGGIHSTIADLGTWAATTVGNDLLSDESVAARLELTDIGVGTPYGLGIQLIGTEYGHLGEAIGWEGWAGHDPQSGITAVVFTNTCSDSDAVLGDLGLLDPAAIKALYES